MVCGCIVADERTEQRASMCSVENGKKKDVPNNPIPERLGSPCTLFRTDGIVPYLGKKEGSGQYIAKSTR